MKTLIVSLSPRKSFSASLYFAKVLRFFMAKGEVSILELKTHTQYQALESQFEQADNLVFVSPVYVDTIPSTALEQLQRLEAYARGKALSPRVYALVNCGFYEGEQCALALNTFRLWCNRCGFEFCGGFGIGAGVMVGFIRTLIPLGAAFTLLELLLRSLAAFAAGSFSAGTVFHHFFPYTLAIQTALYLLWSRGLFVHARKLAAAIGHGVGMDVRYTTVWFCPRFLFVVIASLYWLAASIFWYRGAFWRLSRPPKGKPLA